MNNENNAPAAAPDALQDFPGCPEWGTGGQFIYDPVTKTRTRVGEAPAPAGAVALPAMSENAATTKKERSRA